MSLLGRCSGWRPHGLCPCLGLQDPAEPETALKTDRFSWIILERGPSQGPIHRLLSLAVPGSAAKDWPAGLCLTAGTETLPRMSESRLCITRYCFSCVTEPYACRRRRVIQDRFPEFVCERACVRA